MGEGAAGLRHVFGQAGGEGSKDPAGRLQELAKAFSTPRFPRRARGGGFTGFATCRRPLLKGERFSELGGSLVRFANFIKKSGLMCKG